MPLVRRTQCQSAVVGENIANQPETDCTPDVEKYPKQVWYADDAAAGGKLRQLRNWWEELKEHGPKYGYFP